MVGLINGRLSSISIHAAREGGNASALSRVLIHRRFQSTPPVKAATCKLAVNVAGRRISIHAAREGGDQAKDTLKTEGDYFNPRRP